MIKIPQDINLKHISLKQAKELIRRMPASEKIKLMRELQKETWSKEFQQLLRRIDARRKKHPITQKQINDLLAQLQLLNSQVKTQTTVQQQIQTTLQQTQQNTQQIQQNTTPTVTPSPTPVVTSSPVVTSLNISQEKITGNYPQYPNGWYRFSGKVLDQNGNEMKQPLHMTNPADNLRASTAGDYDGQTIYNGAGSNFDYMPGTAGNKLITFTSGNLTKNVTLSVLPTQVIYDYSIMPKAIKGSEYDFSSSDYRAGTFTISAVGGEPFYVDKITIDSNISNKISVYPASITLTANPTGVGVPISPYYVKNGSQEYRLTIENWQSLPAGTYNLTIKELRAIGLSSGEYKQITGLPITFSFEIKETASYTIQSIVPYISDSESIKKGNVDIWYLINNKTLKPITITKIKAKITSKDGQVFLAESTGSATIQPNTSNQGPKLSFTNTYDSILEPFSIETLSIESDSSVPITGDAITTKYLP